MKLNEAIIINEAKFSEPSIMYHGTSSANIQSILSQGLHSNKSGSGYGGGIQGSAHNRDMTAIGGVYLASSMRTAQAAASSAAGGLGNSVIVVVSVQPHSGYADEDDIDPLIGDMSGRHLSSKNTLEAYVSSKYVGRTNVDILLDRLPMMVGHLFDRQPQGQQLIVAAHQAFLARTLAYSLRNPSQGFMTHPKFILADILGMRDEGAIDEAFDKLLRDVGTPQEAEMRYRDVLERLTVVLRRYAYDKKVNMRALSTGSIGSSMRLPDGIGYRGNNRIIGVIEVDASSRTFIVHYDRGGASHVMNEMRNLYGDYEMRARQ